MTGLGLIIMFFGYAVMYWGIQAITLQDQKPFMSYVFPWSSYTGLTTQAHTTKLNPSAPGLQPNPSAGKGRGQRPG